MLYFLKLNVMKTITLFAISTVLAITNMIGQNTYNLEFFTDETPSFTIFINGIQQHATPTKNVRVEGFIQPILKLKVEFSDTGEVITKNLYMPEESSEITYQVKNTKRGYKVRGYSFVPINEAPPVVVRPEVIIVPYATVPVITQSITSSTTVSSGNGTGVNMGVNTNGVGVNVSVNINESGSFYEETTTTTSISSSQSGVETYVMDGYDGRIGCPWPLSEADFELAKQTIDSKNFDDTRLGMAKQIIRANCMFSDQVRDLVALMSFDDSKLELAKFAYSYTYDVGNYFKVSQSLDFESSVDELNDYIANYRW
jgi:hypothetical protein